MTAPAPRRTPSPAVWGFTLAAVIVSLWTLYQVRSVLLMVYVGALLAIGFSPIVRWLERRRTIAGRRRRLPRPLAILLLYIGLLGTIAGIFAIILPPFVAQVQELWRQLPGYVDMAQERIAALGLLEQQWTWSQLLEKLPPPTSAMGGVLGALQGAIGVLGAIITVFVLPYYFLVEADDVRRGVLRLVPEHRRDSVGRMADQVTIKIGAWLGGQLLLAFIIGTTSALGLWILGVPYFYVLALLAAVGELIPVVGPILAAVPAVLVAGTESFQLMLFVAGFFAVQQFFENNLLVPRVMERQVGVTAVTVIVALLVGGELLGIVGALLAVPTAAIVLVMVQEYLGSREQKGV